MSTKLYFNVSSIVLGLLLALFFAPVVRAEEERPFFFSDVPEEMAQLVSASENTSTVVKYKEYSLSDLDATLSGNLGLIKISLPKKVVADGTGGFSIPEVGGYMSIEILDEEEVWLNSKKKFMTYDGVSENAVSVEEALKAFDLHKLKKSTFQGDKNNPTLTFKGLLLDVDVNGYPDPGSKIELYTMLAYDRSTSQILNITFYAPSESTKTNQKIWQTFEKSIYAKSKITKTSDRVTKSTTYKNAHFSIKLPTGWNVAEELKDQITIVTPNLGASVVVAMTDIDEPIDYDPDLHSFWLSIFLDEYERVFDDFVFVDSKDVTIDGVPWIRIDYTATQKGLPVEGYQIVTVIQGKTYILTASVTNKNQWKKYASSIEKSFMSFKFK